ncbi:MAG: DUF4831 family protein [Prolixibacteraceae bacterium]|nr:DUF4831 family protein [Prolixibacteraceae bacterium]
MRLIIFILALSIAVPVMGQRKKREEETAVQPVYTEGVVYTLPRTGIRIYVKAVAESFEPGPYAAYAGQLLGIKNAKNQATTTWAISDIKVETFAAPDPGQVHKAMGAVASLISLTADGCLTGINSGETTPGIEKIVTSKFIRQPEFSDGFSFDNFTDTPFYTQGDSTNNFQPVRVSVAQKAAEAAKKILDCRMNQYDMVAGLMDEFHPDGVAYKVSLEQLKKTERDYLTLFTGRTTHKKQQVSFDFIPSKTGKGEVVFRFSSEKGVVPATDLSGKPVMVEIVADKELQKKYAGLAKSENPAAGKSGIYYRMPAVAMVNIIQELQTIASARVVLAQFGEVAPLPEDLLSGDFKVLFHPETGAIKSIEEK